MGVRSTKKVKKYLKYVKYSDHCEITGYAGTEAELIIPAEIEELPVTVIKESVFQSNQVLTKVEISDNVSVIDGYEV